MLAQALMTGQTVDPYTQPYGRERERQSEIARTLMGLKRLPQDMVAGAPVVGDIASGVAQWAQDNPLDAGALAVSPVPVVGDIAGLANDVRHYVNDPESRTWTNFGLSALGTLPLVPPFMATFAGIGAKTADFGALAKAKELQASGAPREDVWRETGWFQGVDGSWKFEIDDSGAKLTGADSGTMREVVDHPTLYEAYPQMADVPTSVSPGRYDAGTGYSQYGSWSGTFDEPGIMPELTIASRTKSGLPSAVHEGQHGVETIEGWARGGNTMSAFSGPPKESAFPIYQQMVREALQPPPYADFLVKQNMVDGPDAKAAYESVLETTKNYRKKGLPQWLDRMYQEGAAEQWYRRQAGEALARNAASRTGLSAPERAARAPWLDYDVPENEQIVRFRNRDIANALMQSGGRP
jgi:hypothetical protein